MKSLYSSVHFLSLWPQTTVHHQDGSLMGVLLCLPDFGHPFPGGPLGPNVREESRYQMNFRRKSKRPSTPPSPFGKLYCNFFSENVRKKTFIKVQNLRNINFWIENGPRPPPPFESFPKIHPFWYSLPVPNCVACATILTYFKHTLCSLWPV